MAVLTAKYNSYPSYKPSDVEWIGEVTDHGTNMPVGSIEHL